MHKVGFGHQANRQKDRHTQRNSNTDLNSLSSFISIFLDCQQPFNVEISTDATDDGIADAVQRGLCFDYKQVPC